MKSQEQRIKDAAAALAGNVTDGALSHEDLARIALEAADREPPKPAWPTQEMIDAAARLDINEHYLTTLLAAVWEVDPRRKIVEAAIALRGADRTGDGWLSPARAVIDAVNEAGL